MITQDNLRDMIFCIINKILISKKERKRFLKDKSLKPILELREELLEVADEMKSIYWRRETNIQDGLLPIFDTGEDEMLMEKAELLFKQMCSLHSDIGKLEDLEYGME